MNSSNIKNLLISSLNNEADPKELSVKMEEEGISFDFEEGFTDKILNKLIMSGVTINREIEFVRNMHFAFYRVALTGLVAIVLLLVSIFVMEGSISVDSFLGINSSYDESIISMLTGN